MKIFFALLVSIIILSKSFLAFAAETQIIFWYPGEAGSQAEAQPLLDAFAKLLSTSAPTSLQASYFNDENLGRQYIEKNKPSFGILSYSVWEKWQVSHPESKILLQTVPSHGQVTEKYLLVGKTAPAGLITLISSEPLSEQFISHKLFPQAQWKISARSSKQLLFKLKELAEGKWNGYCLLTPREAASFQALKSPWKQQLIFSQASQPVPSARLVVLNANTANLTEWKNTFLQLSKNPQAAEVLDELSLRGFAE